MHRLIDDKSKSIVLKSNLNADKKLHKCDIILISVNMHTHKKNSKYSESKVMV